MNQDPAHETRSLAESLSSLPASARTRLLSELSERRAEQLLHDWGFWARPQQLTPPGDWRTWLILAGRGFGKTRAGAEWVRGLVEGPSPLAAGQCRRLALVAQTAADGRDVMVEGESGILAISRTDRRPLYEPSKRRLTWPSGAIATLYNASEPDQLRGPQHDAVWADELAKWPRARDAWDNLQFGLRLGQAPRAVVTTTPRPTSVLRDLVAESGTVVTRGSTFDNATNLAPAFLDAVTSKYGGTRIGRQELHGELLVDLPGALWRRVRIDQLRREGAPSHARMVVAVDPAASSGEQSAETGIIVAGRGIDGHGYVLEDVSLRAGPDAWGRAAVTAYHRWRADRIIAEVNNGGDMVGHVIHTVDPTAAFKAVRASRGKVSRAEPVAALYEQGRVHHVGGFPELEDQMCVFTTEPNAMGASPDRVDALVWALSELMLGTAATPRIWSA